MSLVCKLIAFLLAIFLSVYWISREKEQQDKPHRDDEFEGLGGCLTHPSPNTPVYENLSVRDGLLLNLGARMFRPGSQVPGFQIYSYNENINAS